MTEEFKKALLDGGRVMVLSVIAVMIASIQQGQVIDLKVLWMAALVAVLKFLDKYLHESGVADKGIVRF